MGKKWLPVLFLTLLPGCAVQHPQQISANQQGEFVGVLPRTKAEHLALAVQYERDAETLREQAEQHQRIAGYYRQNGGRMLVRRSLMEHYLKNAMTCRSAAEEKMLLAKRYRDAAIRLPR